MPFSRPIGALLGNVDQHVGSISSRGHQWARARLTHLDSRLRSLLAIGLHFLARPLSPFSLPATNCHFPCSRVGASAPSGDYYAAAYHGYYATPNAYGANSPYSQIGAQSTTPTVVPTNQTLISK